MNEYDEMQRQSENSDVIAEEKTEYHKGKKSFRGVGGFLKKTTGLVVGAAVFGLVAGGVFRYVSEDTLRELRDAKTVEVRRRQG